LRYSLRQFRRNPGFATVVTLSLACGIGANTAIFSAINALLLKSLPVRDAQQLVQLDSVNRDHVNTLRGFSYPGFVILRKAGNPLLSGLFAYTSPDTSSSIYSSLAASNVIYQGNAALAKGMLASPAMYSVLGVEPAIGRLFVADDDRVEGGSPVVVLSYAYWQARLGGDRTRIGKSVIINQVPFTVIGVTPPGFGGVELGYVPDFTAPLSMANALNLQSMGDGSRWWLAILGRKKPGVSDREVETALQPAFHLTVADLIQSTPTTMAQDIQKMVSGLVLKVNPANQGASASARDELRRSFAYLMAVVVMLLGIACVNIANLILARTAARQTEICVRLSLGASRARIFRQFLTEIALLALMGGVLSLPVAWRGGPLLLTVFADQSISQSLNLNPDWRVFFFSLSAAVACTLFLSLVPIFQIAGTRLHNAAHTSRSSTSKVPDALMATQIALALLLAVGAGLLVRSFQNIRRINPGFRPDQVLVFNLTPSSAGYSNARVQQFYDDLVAQLERLPAVSSVSFARTAPGGTNIGTLVRVPGEQPRSQKQTLGVNFVASRYFQTVGIDLLLGRAFDVHDAAVAIVNQTFVRQHFGNKNPLGRTFTILGEDKTPIQIVGVVRDVKEHGLLSETPPMAYLPYQHGSGGDMAFFVRTQVEPLSLIPAVRQELKRLDPLVPLSGVTTLNLQLDESVSRERLLAVLSSIMGVLALTLASVGLYGVISYSVSRETKSIGIRMALGAKAGTILWNVFRRVLLLLSSGIGIGLLCVFGLSRYLKSLLYGLSPNDPANIVVSAAILIVISLLAAYFPAREAARVDPMIALREE
jgi:predicted permease